MVELPEGLQEIEMGAFRGCCSLAIINFPSTLTVISSMAFYRCTKLAEVTLPEGLLEIGESAFAECDSLATIKIPSTVKLIPRDAFRWCKKIVEVELREGIQEIGDNAFAYCKLLRQVIVPPSTKVISDGAFRHCSNMTVLTLPDTIEDIGDAFERCGFLHFRIPPLVEKIKMGKHSTSVAACVRSRFIKIWKNYNWGMTNHYSHFLMTILMILAEI